MPSRHKKTGARPVENSRWGLGVETEPPLLREDIEARIDFRKGAIREVGIATSGFAIMRGIEGRRPAAPSLGRPHGPAIS